MTIRSNSFSRVDENTSIIEIARALNNLVEEFNREPRLRVTLSSGTPTGISPQGTALFDPSTNKLWIYNGTSWVSTTLA